MMRISILAALLLAACSTEEPAAPGLAGGSYSGEGRNRLCIGGEEATQRAGLIAYGPANTNCSASGAVESTETGLALVPRGDSECRIPLSVNGNEVRIGDVPPACSYYCGPGATLAGKTFSKDSADTLVTDLADEPLC